MERAKFVRLGEEALEALPKVFKDRLQNVDVVVEDEPDPFQLRAVKAREGRSLLGLYHGVPLPKRRHDYGMVMPDKISIFKNNIERKCKSEEEIVRTVARTVRHELAHHFGITDGRMKRLDIY